jgi:threonylcarbamoyladenosine tRNA methylthiotransferase MtaB
VSRVGVIEAVRGLVELGHQEVVLTGIHLGMYGRDREPADDLASLCRAILAETALPRLRLSSMEPNEATPPLIDLMAADDRLCAHLHIPLQSGSDRILRAMNRPYATADYAALVERLRARLPNITIGADVIVGFPGEDEAAFAETLAFLERIRLPHLHVFPYSDRPGTPAARMPGQLARGVIKERAAIVRQLGRAHRLEHLRRQVGRQVRVLIEETRDGEGRGLSREYLPARLLVGAAIGREVPATVAEVDEESVELICELR